MRRPPTEARVAGGPGLGRAARAALVVLGVAYGVLAVVLWADPAFGAEHGPIAGGPLGLRFIGSWAAFLAIGAIYAAAHPGWEQARMNVVTLTVFPLAALGAVLVTDLPAARSSAMYAGTLVVLAAVPVPSCSPGPKRGLSAPPARRRLDFPPTRGGAVR